MQCRKIAKISIAISISLITTSAFAGGTPHPWYGHPWDNVRADSFHPGTNCNRALSQLRLIEDNINHLRNQTRSDSNQTATNTRVSACEAATHHNDTIVRMRLGAYSAQPSCRTSNSLLWANVNQCRLNEVCRVSGEIEQLVIARTDSYIARESFTYHLYTCAEAQVRLEVHNTCEAQSIPQFDINLVNKSFTTPDGTAIPAAACDATARFQPFGWGYFYSNNALAPFGAVDPYNITFPPDAVPGVDADRHEHEYQLCAQGAPTIRC